MEIPSECVESKKHVQLPILPRINTFPSFVSHPTALHISSKQLHTTRPPISFVFLHTDCEFYRQWVEHHWLWMAFERFLSLQSLCCPTIAETHSATLQCLTPTRAEQNAPYAVGERRQLGCMTRLLHRRKISLLLNGSTSLCSNVCHGQNA